MNKRQQKKFNKKFSQFYKNCYNITPPHSFFDVLEMQILGYEFEYRELVKHKKGKTIKIKYKVKTGEYKEVEGETIKISRFVPFEPQGRILGSCLNGG